MAGVFGSCCLDDTLDDVVAAIPPHRWTDSDECPTGALPEQWFGYIALDEIVEGEET